MIKKTIILSFIILCGNRLDAQIYYDKFGKISSDKQLEVLNGVIKEYLGVDVIQKDSIFFLNSLKKINYPNKTNPFFNIKSGQSFKVNLTDMDNQKFDFYFFEINFKNSRAAKATIKLIEKNKNNFGGEFKLFVKSKLNNKEIRFVISSYVKNRTCIEICNKIIDD